MSTCKATVILGGNDICKDCMKADVCKHKANIDKDPIIGMSVEQCEYFKDKSKFIELPCRMGDYIEWRNEWGDIVFLEVTGFDFDEKGNAVKYHTKYSDIQPYVDETEIVPKEKLSQERGKLND